MPNNLCDASHYQSLPVIHYQSLPANTCYSHSIGNNPRKSRIGAGFLVAASINTMKNTIINFSCGNLLRRGFNAEVHTGSSVLRYHEILHQNPMWLKELERENRAFKQANEILRKVSAFFVQAELGCRSKI